MKSGLRILITNNTLATRAGSELYVRDVALSLLRRGHRPIAYSTVLGDVAEELRSATIPVINDLRLLSEVPDIIHGQHHLDAMTAMLHFPEVPAVYACHGWIPWEEHPALFPNIKYYIAVDDLCRERLLTTGNIRPEKIKTLYNFVDLKRFTLRTPLPKKPESALIFSNYANETNYAAAIRAACIRFGIKKVDIVGIHSGKLVNKPETILGQYDIVFAKARCALEAMASGCAVIVADFAGLGGLVTMNNVQRLRCLNFGVRTMQMNSITEDNILAELEQYNHLDAQQVSNWIRADANIDNTIDQLLTIYNSVIDTSTDTLLSIDDQAKTLFHAASDYIRFLTPTMKSHYAIIDSQLKKTLHEHQLLQGKLKETEINAQKALADAHANFNTALATQEKELTSIYKSRAWKAVSRYWKIKSWIFKS